MTDVHALSGAYAIDALDDAERAQFEQHLALCSECRAEVAGLQEAGAELGALLTQAARGDDQAFATFYDATSSRAFGLALRVVRNPAQAEEVVQEGYLEVWRTATRFDRDQGSAVSWLFTIVHRRAVDRVRYAEAVRHRDENYHSENHAVPHDSTADEAHASIEARRVRRALRTLTPIQREALELAYFGGYTYTEVATMLRLPVGTAKARIRDGLLRLREPLEAGRTPKGAAR